MAKHTLKEILAHFGKHAEHTHEAAAQATYDLGHAAGREEAKAEFAAGVGDSSPAASTGASSDVSQQKDAPTGQSSESGEGAQTESTESAETEKPAA